VEAQTKNRQRKELKKNMTGNKTAHRAGMASFESWRARYYFFTS
jgi:hypothetical protein